MLLDQFRSFYFQNYPGDMETQIEYFSIFGGLGWEIDTSRDINFLVRSVILENFDVLDEKMDALALGDTGRKRLLSALAQGDRRMFSAFNRAGMSNTKGGAALNYFQEKGLIQVEYSREEVPTKKPGEKLKKEDAKRRISHKVLFTQPFVRFWFYFVFPHAKEIKNNDYDNFFKRFEERRHSYTSLIFEELSELLLNYHLRDAQIVTTGSYWDAKVEIDILTVTENGNVYVGECKWTNHKVNKKEVHKVMEKCEKLDLQPTQIVLFSKRGFSKELEQNQSKELSLYSAEDFAILLKSGGKYEPTEDFIPDQARSAL
ncbi:MAG: DUF234 domain-containing protein [Sulfurimonadaceae bacterium]|jgi:hypothetical protein